MTAEAGQEITIHFRIALQMESWSGLHSENYWVSPAEPWQQSMTVEDPDSAYVSVRNIWWNPPLHGGADHQPRSRNAESAPGSASPAR
ncbi:hypothetical protein HNP40_000249 [Mycobacteroides chelonae]|nr:hypothetical protein [Mycobacteroides chelonae]